jgi:dTDP-glucose 4,6-dehydratase
VTGAAGFIGSNFVRMIASGELVGISGVKVLDKLTYAGVKGNLDSAADLTSYEFVQGDICDSLVVSELLKEVDAVINFAAESHVDRSISGASDFVQTNIVGVQVLLDAIKDSGKKLDFCKYQLMRCMDQLSQDHGLRSGHCNQTPHIQRVKQVENY